MIEFLEVPYAGTNTKDGFEILIHGFVLIPITIGAVTTHELHAILINEEGVLHTLPVEGGAIATDWRYTRGRGWHALTDTGPGQDDE